MEIKQNLTNVNITVNGMREIRGIVLHSMWGTYAGSLSWFKNPEAQASAHYSISQDGEITQSVLDKDMAWHAGVFDEPIADWLKPNPNWYCIGIEFEDRRDANWPYPQAQREAGAWLVNLLMSKYKIAKDHILLHKNLNPSRRTDPVGQFSFDWLFQTPTTEEISKIEKLPKDSIIKDVYKSLTGEYPKDDELAWRLSEGKNIQELIEAIASGDERFQDLWVKPSIDAKEKELQSACDTLLSTKQQTWQKSLDDAKALRIEEAIKQATGSQLFDELLSRILAFKKKEVK